MIKKSGNFRMKQELKRSTHVQRIFRKEEIDKTYKNGSNSIDSITASSEVMEFTKGCSLLNHNSMIETNQRVYLIDANVKEYFREEINAQGNNN